MPTDAGHTPDDTGGLRVQTPGDAATAGLLNIVPAPASDTHAPTPLTAGEFALLSECGFNCGPGTWRSRERETFC